MDAHADDAGGIAGSSAIERADQTLDRLGREDPRMVRLIEMRFVAGVTAKETAEADGESMHIVRHNLRHSSASAALTIGPAARRKLAMVSCDQES